MAQARGGQASPRQEFPCGQSVSVQTLSSVQAPQILQAQEFDNTVDSQRSGPESFINMRLVAPIWPLHGGWGMDIFHDKNMLKAPSGLPYFGFSALKRDCWSPVRVRGACACRFV